MANVSVPVFTFRDPNLHEKYRVGLNRIAAQDVPIEIKLVNPPTLSQLGTLEPKQMFWVRARGYIGKRTHELGKTLQESRSCHSFILCHLGIPLSLAHFLI